MISLFKSKPFVDEATSQWLFDAFGWAIQQFDGQFFADKSQLILPTNEFFPNRAKSVEELATSVFDNVSGYCGLTKWPFKLVDPQQYAPQQYQVTQPLLIVRGEDVAAGEGHNMLANQQQPLTVSYDPVQLNQPQVMVANYAAMLSSYLMGLSSQLPPGGEEHRAPAIEILSIFMGFGVMFANTAYAFRGGCASCHDHRANRTAVLTENESIYALAMFCLLKDIDNKTVTPHLKKHLRGMYKQAVKQIQDQSEDFENLRIMTTAHTLSLSAS
jgi:hypothetical protein